MTKIIENQSKSVSIVIVGALILTDVFVKVAAPHCLLARVFDLGQRAVVWVDPVPVRDTEKFLEYLLRRYAVQLPMHRW